MNSMLVDHQTAKAPSFYNLPSKTIKIKIYAKRTFFSLELSTQYLQLYRRPFALYYH